MAIDAKMKWQGCRSYHYEALPDAQACAHIARAPVKC